ncbi:MAG: hypothetical protein MUE42_00090 [Opitutaceae bacterium]|nr:hypothetical protein [Opitutaceae bacterium]
MFRSYFPRFRTLLAALTAMGVSQALNAIDAISFNVHGITAANSLLAPTAQAGAPAARSANWNSFFGAPVTTAVDGNGRTLALSLGFVVGSTGGSIFGGGNATDGDPRMFGSFFDQYNGTPSTFTISSIPYATYDIYVYCLDATTGNNRGGSVSVGGATKFIRTGIAATVTTADGSGYLEATDTVNNGATTTLGNYVRFTGLSGSSQTISTVALNMGDATQRLKIVGFQLVNTGAALSAPASAPAAPGIVEIVPGNQRAIVVWGRALDATSYSVRRGTSASGPFVEVGVTDAMTTKFTDTGLTNGDTYHYVVAAINSQGATEGASASAVPTDGASLRGVGVQFRSGGTAMAAATLAGAPGARQANWNSFTGNTLDAMSTLVDNTGSVVSGLSFTHAEVNNNWTNAGSPTVNDVALYSGHHDKFDGTAANLTVSGIPYARYDVYFYIKDDTLDRAGSVSIGSTTYFITSIYGNGGGHPASDGTGYIRSADTEATLNGAIYDVSTIAKGNYVKFEGVTGSSFTANYTALATSAAARRLKVAGFQIVDTTPAGSPPASPTGLVANGGDAQVSLSWNPASSATSYTVKRSESYNGAFTDLATIGGTSYTDSTAVNGTFYYYTVTANNTGGSSVNATPVSAVPLNYVPLAIGFDLHGPAAVALAPAERAGAPSVRLPNWNGLPVPVSEAGFVTPGIIVDSAGAAVTGLTLTYTNGTSGNAGASSGLADDAKLFGTFADIYGDTPTSTPPQLPSRLIATGIPYATYDVYFYIRNDGAARAAAITVNGTTYYTRGGLADPQANGAGYVLNQGTDAGPVPDPLAVPTVVSTIPQGNMILVKGLSGDLDATLAAQYAGDAFPRLKLGGFQIVKSGAPAPATTAPASVVGVSVVGGVGQNTVTWSPVNGATGYRVERADSPAGPYVALATVSAFVNTYTDSNLPDNTTYYYQVVALNSVGDAVASSVVSGTTNLAPATGLAATAGDGQVTLSWTGTAIATGYEIRVRDAAGAFPELPAQTVTGTSATVTGLTNGNAYYFVVRVRSGVLSSADTAEVLSVPVKQSVVRSIGLNFTNAAAAIAANVPSGVANYRQGNWNNYQVTAPNTVAVLGPVAGSYVDNTGVAVSGFTSEFTSSASSTGARGKSTDDGIYRSMFDQSDAGASNVVLFGIPYAKYDLLVYVYDDNLRRVGSVTVNDLNTVTTYYIRGLGESENLGNPNSAGQGYVLANQTTLPAGGAVAAAQGNYLHIVGLTSPAVQVEFTALPGGEATRRIKIAAVQVVNTSESTSLPAAATDLAAVAGNGQVALSWTAASAVSSYHVRRSVVAGGPYETIARDVAGSTYLDTSVTNGVTYHYVVTSVGSTAGTDSTEVSATPNLPAPAAPTNLVAIGRDGAVDLSWNAAATATTYTVRRATTAGGPYDDISVGVVSGTSYTDSSVTNGTTYYYVVAGVAGTSVGPNSNQASATPNGNALETWRQSYFGAGATNTGAAANNADPDADGIANLIEYATGTDPLVAGPSPVTIGRSGNSLTLTYTRIADPLLIYTVEGGDDLSTWSTITADNNPSTGVQNIAGQVTVIDTVSLTSQPRRFLRLKVSY